ncbi:MAG: arginase family protein [Bacteroidia bacterium]|nr:arginase family protein [Bacteroidia bacterium]MCX7652458.1 arginase family protein [Bacteroidia bacterium]MDW8416860.1 arginase family protein [Bacteroidia bacterium]
MEWTTLLSPVAGHPMHSQRLSIAASFPSGHSAVEEALSREVTAVFVGYPYYYLRGYYRSVLAAPAFIRRKLYRLALPSPAMRIVDLGNIQSDKPAEALEIVVNELLRLGHRVVILGGGQEAAHPLFRAVAAQEMPFTYTLIDRKLDLLDTISMEEAPYRRFHRDMLIDNSIDVTTHGQIIGLAWHWVSPAEEEILHSHLRVPYLRLNEILSDPNRAEPYLRLPALVSMDLGVVRGADAPSVLDAEPEGLPIEVAAKLMRFAGMGYRTDVLHIANYLPLKDGDRRTAAAVALLVWYYLEGRVNPQDDFPAADRHNLVRYSVPVAHSDIQELIFYQHPRTGRWWMEVSSIMSAGPSRLFPCTRYEYEVALTGEVPRLWEIIQLTMV